MTADARNDVRFQPAARRAVSERLPEAVAAAAFEFCAGPLAENPQRVGKPLSGAFEGCHGARRGSYRVIYRIDDQRQVVDVLDIAHRQDAYRPRQPSNRVDRESLVLGQHPRHRMSAGLAV